MQRTGRSAWARGAGVVALAAGLLAAACGGTGEPGAATTPADAAAVPADPPPDRTEAPVDAPSAPTLAGSSGPGTLVGRPASGSDNPLQQAMRIGQHPGVDRLVFDFGGDGVPPWQIAWLDDAATECGSGDDVALAGTARLQVRFFPAQAHSNAGGSTIGERQRTVAQPNLLGLARTCDFEGEVVWVAGLARRAPYTVRVLDAPARLVVDIAH